MLAAAAPVEVPAHSHDGHTHSHDDGHSHDGHSHDGHDHAHGPGGHTHAHDGSMDEAEHAALHAREATTEISSWKDLLSLGISGGITPCPAGILLIVVSLTLKEHNTLRCFVYLNAFSVGLGAVLVGIAVLMVMSRSYLASALTGKRRALARAASDLQRARRRARRRRHLLRGLRPELQERDRQGLPGVRPRETEQGGPPTQVRLRSKILLAAGAIVLLAPASLLCPAVRVRAEVAWLGSRLHAKDPMARADARQSLLALGRPAIDAEYPEIVAGEVEDEVTGQDAVVFVGGVGQGDYSVETVLRGAAQGTIAVTGSPVCPTAMLLRHPTKRALVVAARRPGSTVLELRLEIPLDGAPEAAILSLVRERLGK